MCKSLGKIIHPVSGQVLAEKNQKVNFGFLVNLYLSYGIEIFYLKMKDCKVRVNLRDYYNGGKYMVKI